MVVKIKHIDTADVLLAVAVAVIATDVVIIVIAVVAVVILSSLNFQ